MRHMAFSTGAAGAHAAAGSGGTSGAALTMAAGASAGAGTAAGSGGGSGASAAAGAGSGSGAGGTGASPEPSRGPASARSFEIITEKVTEQPAGKLDASRIVVAGNSCGGVTALEVAGVDQRLAAVFVLSGSSALGSVNKQVMQSVKVPVGYIVGGDEDIAGANASGDYDALAPEIPALIVHRFEGDHQTVSTDTMILPHVAEISLKWLDLALYGTPEAYTALTSPNVCDSCKPGDWKLQSKHLETLTK